MLSLMTAALGATACFEGEEGWVASPEGRCYRLTQPVSSLRACISECGPAAPPVCVTSEAEASFLMLRVALNDARNWLGIFQSNVTDETTSGWSCVSGENSTFAAWAAGQPALGEGLGIAGGRTAVPLLPGTADGSGEDCVVMDMRFGNGDSTTGAWYDTPCDSFGLWKRPCICATPPPGIVLTAPLDLEADLLKLEAAAWASHANWTAAANARNDAHLEDLRGSATVGILFALAVGLVPSLVMTIWNRVNALRRDHGGSAKAMGAASLKLAAASRAASDVRLRISISLFTINFTIFVVGFLPTFAMFDGKWLIPVLGPKIVWDCMWTLSAPGLFLAISPTDKHIIYGICCFLVPFCLFWGGTFTAFLFFIAAAGYGPEVYLQNAVRGIAIGGAGLYGLPTLFCSCCSCGGGRWLIMPRQKLFRLWVMIRVLYAGFAAAAAWDLAQGLSMKPYGQRPGRVSDGIIEVVASLIVALAPTPKNRARALRAIGNIGKLGTKEHEAATVAALVGGGSAERALANGAKKFRALPITQLAEADLQTNTDGAVLHAKTMEAKLGDVESFISHSWSDDGSLKFEALQTWRTEVKSRNGGSEPFVWLDKACIDQADIQGNISTLPVFLSGCRTLLVLAGPTYATRLWCGPPLPPHHAPALPPHTYPGGYALTLLSRPGASSSCSPSSAWAASRSSSA